MSTERIDTPLVGTDEKNLDLIPIFDTVGASADGAGPETNSAGTGTTNQAGAVEVDTLSVESLSSDSPQLSSEVDAEAHAGLPLNFRPRGKGDKPVVGKPLVGKPVGKPPR